MERQWREEKRSGFTAASGAGWGCEAARVERGLGLAGEDCEGDLGCGGCWAKAGNPIRARTTMSDARRGNEGTVSSRTEGGGYRRKIKLESSRKRNVLCSVGRYSKSRGSESASSQP